MTFLSRLISRLRKSEENAVKDVLVSLVLEARENAAFGEHVMRVLNLPAADRELFVRTAVEEMERQGEPVKFRAAFLVLATPRGAEFVAKAIDASVARRSGPALGSRH